MGSAPSQQQLQEQRRAREAGLGADGGTSGPSATTAGLRQPGPGPVDTGSGADTRDADVFVAAGTGGAGTSAPSSRGSSRGRDPRPSSPATALDDEPPVGASQMSREKLDLIKAKMQLKLDPGALKPMLKMWKLRAQLQLEHAKLDAGASSPGSGGGGGGHPDPVRAAQLEASFEIPGKYKVPQAPRQMSATGRSITMSWVCQVANVTRYEVQVKPLNGDGSMPDGPWKTITRNARTTEITVHDLRSGALFAVRVRARVANTWTDYSPVSRPARTVKLCPERPDKPKCDDVTTTSMKVSWEAPEDNGSRITIYTLLCGKVADRGDMVVLYSGPSCVCDALNLQPATRYTFRVIATNAFGDSDVSEPCMQATSTPRTDAPLRTIGCWSEWWDHHSRRVYFVNEVTHERAWELPASLNTLMRRFGEWSEYWDETSQHCFYYNHRTGDRSWEPPADLTEVPDAPGVGEDAASGASDSDSDSDMDTGAGAGADATAGAAAAAEGKEEAKSGGASDTAGAGAGAGTGAGAGAGAGDTGFAAAALAEAEQAAARVRSTYAVTRTAPVSQEDRAFRKKRFQLLWAARVSTIRPGTLTVDIRRKYVLSDSIAALERFKPAELQRKLVIKFRDEEGIDAGGLTKDWCLLLSRKACSERVGLFVRSATGHVDVNPRVIRKRRGVETLRVLGRFIGKAVFERHLIDMPLSRALCLRIIGKSPGLDDLSETDPELQKGLRWVLDNDITDILFSTFSVESDVAQSGADAAGAASDETKSSDAGGGKPGEDSDSSADGAAAQVVDLVPGGRDIDVSEQNKKQYVELMAAWRAGGEAQEAVDAFVEGVHELLPKEQLAKFTVEELRALLNGRQDVDLASMRKTTKYQGDLKRKSQVVRWFWRCLMSFSREDRGLFLRFTTGTSSVPLDGFDPPFTLTSSEMHGQALPRSHTCFNQLVMPQYASFEQLREKLLFAIHNTDSFTLS